MREAKLYNPIQNNRIKQFQPLIFALKTTDIIIKQASGKTYENQNNERLFVEQCK